MISLAHARSRHSNRTAFASSSAFLSFFDIGCLTLVLIQFCSWLYLLLFGFLACTFQLTLRVAAGRLILVAIVAIAAAVFALARFLGLFRLTANRIFKWMQISLWTLEKVLTRILSRDWAPTLGAGSNNLKKCFWVLESFD